MNDSTSIKPPALTNFFLRDFAQQKARDLVYDGFFAYRQTDYQRAESCFRDALICDPNNNAAKKYVSLFDAVKQGKREYEDALNEKKAGNFPRSPQYLEKAKSAFQQALRIESDYLPARTGLSMVFSSDGFDKLARGDYEGALNVFRTLFHFNPGFNTSYVPLIHLLTQKGKVALERKEFDVAEQFFAEAVQVDKFSGSSSQELVNLQIALHIQHARSEENSPRKALVLLNKALALDPLNGEAWLYSGMCYEELGKPIEAIRCYKKIREEIIDGFSVSSQIQATSTQGKKHASLLRESEKFQKQREFDKAIKALNEILEKCSEHVEALQGLKKIERAKEKRTQTETASLVYRGKLRSLSGNPVENHSNKRPRKGQ